MLSTFTINHDTWRMANEAFVYQLPPIVEFLPGGAEEHFPVLAFAHTTYNGTTYVRAYSTVDDLLANWHSEWDEALSFGIDLREPPLRAYVLPVVSLTRDETHRSLADFV